MLERILYKVGQKVKVAGLYVCVPCGNKKRFQVGDVFPKCLGCMRVSREIGDSEFQEAAEQGIEIDEFGEEAVAPNLETWELIKETR